MVRVKVKISNIAVGPSPTDVTTYKRGQIFECSDDLVKKLGKDVEIIPEIAEPAKPTASTKK